VYDSIAQAIETANKVVVFTGAGISTESGIPDFRSPGGIWTKMKPIQFQDFVASEEIRRESWSRRFSGEETTSNAKPNKGHLAVAKLVQAGKVTHVITQNVDNLHQDSGVPEDQVIELHGNATYASCLNCGLRYEMADVKEAFLKTQQAPNCQACGGIIKSATISFGQAMPVMEMTRAEQATLECDLFLAIGSSLVVYPAASFPLIAKQNGATLVILNREETDLDGYADFVINDEIGPVLSTVVKLD
jgi:NAD-dependent deacetylase